MLLWWWMLAAAVVVFVGAVAMLVLAWVRRGSPGLPWLAEREDISERMVLLFGIGIPIVVPVILFGVSDVYMVGQTSPPNPSTLGPRHSLPSRAAHEPIKIAANETATDATIPKSRPSRPGIRAPISVPDQAR